MSLARHAKRRDLNEPEIVSALRAAGAHVWLLDRPVDLLVGFRGAWHVIEVKRPGKASASRQQATQREMLALAGAGVIPPVHLVTTAAEALAALGITPMSTSRAQDGEA